MIVFVSNYYNHHQAPVAEEMYRLTNGQYRFIAVGRVPEWRKEVGYKELTADFVINASESKSTYYECISLINNADIVIAGAAPEEMLKQRKKNRKIIIRYSERPLKNGREVLKYPARLLKWHYNNPIWCPIYMLCAGGYTAGDYAKFGLFLNKCYKWGYFPKFKKQDNIDSLIASKQKNSILWVSRFIALKHPEIPISVAKRLKADGYDFEMNLIGIGPSRKAYAEKITELGLDDCIHILGPMPNEDVIKFMEKSEIFLFTSDRREGWGTVLNEAMGCGCAVVANSEVGAVPFLIKDGINGIKYNSNKDFDFICTRVKELLENDVIRKELGKRAYKTIESEWAPEIVAQRLLNLSNELLKKNKRFSYKSGPCSKV